MPVSRQTSDGTQLVVITNPPAIDPTYAARELPIISQKIRVEYDKGVRSTLAAFEARIAIGHLLNAARELHRGDREFGEWVKAQDFGWGPQWTTKLMQSARLEPYMRQALPSPEALEDGEPIQAPNFVKTLEAAKRSAVTAGEWTAPPPKKPLDPERGLTEAPETAQAALVALVESADVARFMAIPDEEWLQVSHQMRRDATEVFKKITERMLQVHALWRGDK